MKKLQKGEMICSDLQSHGMAERKTGGRKGVGAECSLAGQEGAEEKALRKESEGWRIAGAATVNGPSSGRGCLEVEVRKDRSCCGLLRG